MVMTTKERLQRKMTDRGMNDGNILTKMGIDNINEIIHEERRLFNQNYPKTVKRLETMTASYGVSFIVHISMKILVLIEKLQTNHYKDLFIENLPNEVIDVACDYYLRACYAYYKIMTE
jgi:hypothetical protein